MKRTTILLGVCCLALSCFTGCSKPAIDEALLEASPVTVECYRDWISYSSKGIEKNYVGTGYTFTGYPSEVKILEVTDSTIKATAIIENAYYRTTERAAIDYLYWVADDGEIILNGSIPENTVTFEPTIEFDADMFFELEEPLVLSYQTDEMLTSSPVVTWRYEEIPITRDNIEHIELVTDTPCSFSSSVSAAYFQGEVHFTAYNGTVYCAIMKIYFPPFDGSSKTAEQEYSEPPAWKITWNTSNSATLVN